MGVTGLLPFLKKIHQPVNVSKFEGCTIAIDAYCWLHKGAFSCAEKLALGEKTDQYVYYCMKYINTLLAKNIKPIMVFDGCHLPSKKNVETSRREKRELNRKKAAQFLREGRRAEARECLQRCIDISPEMALEVMNVCRSKGVDCIVAPYEADAQLAYLNKIGVAQVIVTEDSDLLLFGCDQVLFKMDHAGNGILIQKDQLNEVMSFQASNYTFEKFRYMCILSGCDYLPSLSGVGLAKANKAFKLARQADIKQVLRKLSSYLKLNITVPQDYIDGFIQANNTFLYQLVFDPLQRLLVPLTPYPADIKQEDVVYAGHFIQPDKAYQLALGNINIYTNKRFSHYNPDTYVPKYVKKKPEAPHLLSIWDKNYRPYQKAGHPEVQACERPTLIGKEVTMMSSLSRISPKKRLREAEDTKVVKSNLELSSLYVQSSPTPCKRRKTEEMSNQLHRFMISDEPQQSDGSTKSINGEEEIVREGQEFFSSLSKAHPEDQSGANIDSNTENCMISPIRNVFAFKSPSKKPKFNLDAMKAVSIKSRFFDRSGKQLKLSQSLQPTSKLKSVCGGKDTMDGYTVVHENTANKDLDILNDCTNTDDERAVDNSGHLGISKIAENSKSSQSKSFSFNKSKTCDSKPSVKPHPLMFDWSKFKFVSKHRASEKCFNVKSSTSPTKYDVDKRICKNDILTNSYSSAEKGSNLNPSCSPIYDDVLDTNIKMVEDNISKGSNSSECNLRSYYPDRIESDCLSSQSVLTLMDTQSQKTSLSQEYNDPMCIQSRKKGLSIYLKAANSTHTAESDSVMTTDKPASREGLEDHVQDGEVVIEPDSVTCNEVEQAGLLIKHLKPNKADKIKAGCRVSGLSRKSKAPLKEDSWKQQKLKDMFSKFAHSDCVKSKMKPRHDGLSN